MKDTLFSSLALLGLFLLLAPRLALADKINTNSPAPAVVDMEDSPDSEDEDDGCDPPAGNDGPSGDGSPCEKNSAPGMAVWRVSEPYINLWLDDTPLRYRLASGKWMELTLSYKQRGETREDFLDTFGPGWSCNWMGLAVRSNTPTAPIFLHKAGGGREILITNQFSPRTLGEPVCCMAPCGWQNGVQINSPGGSSRIYTNTICSPFPDSASVFPRPGAPTGVARNEWLDLWTPNKRQGIEIDLVEWDLGEKACPEGWSEDKNVPLPSNLKQCKAAIGK